MNRREMLGILIGGGMGYMQRKAMAEEGTYGAGIHVAIVGAGASGLAAAQVLTHTGCSVTIYEATGVAGGRVGVLKGFSDRLLDTGAQWLHGAKSTTAIRLQKQGIRYFQDQSVEYLWNGHTVIAATKEWEVIKKLFEQMPPSKDTDYLSWAVQKGVLQPDWVEAMSANFGASATQLSAWGHANEEKNWHSGNSDYLFEHTWYEALMHLYSKEAAGLVQYATPIVHIDASNPKNGVFLSDSYSQQYKADGVIVTVPMTMLRSGTIHFEPSLPVDQLKAWNTIGMTDGMKVYLKFSNRFFDPNIIGGRICGNYIDCNWQRSAGDVVLLAFLTGYQATRLHRLGNDTKRVEALLHELDCMYEGKASKSFIQGHVCNWSDHPFIQGAYSFAASANSAEMRLVAGKPFQGVVFFAGEAMCTNGHRQTVHGAIERGEEVARELVAGLNKR